jgi:mono/diheme cytochrome c family protein
LGNALGTLLVVLISLASTSAAPPVAPPPPQQADRDEPGLVLTIEPLDAAARKASDTRPVRMPALYVPAGAAASPFLAPGRFRATWTGDLNLRLRERMGFVVEGRGKLSIKLKDKVVFEAEGDDLSAKAGEVVRIDKGKNPIVVTYESPASGDAFLRVNWKEQRGLRADPVPPTTFTHTASMKAVVEGVRVRQGRQLLADLRCTKCHAVEAAGMPDLAQDAPALSDVGTRLNSNWLAAWVEDPRRFRKDAHMPRVIHNRADAVDVAAYLTSLAGWDLPPIKPGKPPPEVEARGGQLFSSLMCVACHSLPDARATAEGDTRIPLSHVTAKFRIEALRDYLLDPQAHYAWSPMPNFKLNEGEAWALAAFLASKSKMVVAGPARQGDAEKGRQLVRASGCLNCHPIEKETTTASAPAFAAIDAGGWTRGCMAADPAARKNAPDFGLTEPQRSALLALAATDRSSLSRETPMEFSLRQVTAMRCTACHARDGKESAVSTDYAAEAGALAAAYPPPQPSGSNAEGEFFAPDQRPPILMWAGEKLRPEWAAAFIGGRVDYKPRPYLHARMPAFPARAKLIAEGLAAEHGYSPTTPGYPKPDEQMAAAGQKLIGAAGGFSCVQCHAVGAAPPLAPFEAPAANMKYISERLRKDYYDRWMLNPIKVDPGTKMPAFADAEGKSAIRDVYEGDAVKQFEAVWQFLLRGKDVRPPQ